MTASQKLRQKRYSLFILAILLLLSGGAALYLGSHNFTIRFFGLLALMASAYFVRISLAHTRSTSAASGERVDFTAAKGPGHLVWAVGVALLLLAGVSYLLMYVDALRGGHTGWPAYMFAGVGIACAGVWGYLISKLVWRGR